MTDSGTSPGSRQRSENHADSPQRAWKVFTRLIKTKNQKITQARRIIFDEVFSRHDHFSADELAGDLAHGKRHVSRSTVYNTLNLLVEAGLVCEVCDRHGRVRYEHTFGHPAHDHMICEECGAFFEFRDDSLAERIADDCRESGFVPRGHRVTVFGVCREFLEGGADACPHHRRRRR
jgi:Fur family ferric uptake transcriptional regulator